MTKYRIFIALIILAAGTAAALFATGHRSAQARNRSEIPAKRELVRVLGLTDLALWTEARYTRHPSQADQFTPFQEFPSSPEHFPAGSIVAPRTVDPPAGAEEQ